MQSTSIRINTTTRDRLHRLKNHPRESFDAVITRLLDLTIDEEPLSEETLATIERSLKEYREGIYYTHEEILHELGVTEDLETSEIVDTSEQSSKDSALQDHNETETPAKPESDA